MPVYKAEGVVLRRRNLGEADRVLTLLTREWGKISARARGVRRTASPLSGRLEPFTHGRFLLARGRALDVVAQVEVVEGFVPLRDDLERMAYASLAAELTDRLLAEHEPHPEVFGILLAAQSAIASGDPAIATVWYALHLFAALGYLPVTDRCAVCGRQPTPRWSARLGGLVCGRCAREDPQALEIGGEAAGAIGFLVRSHVQDIGRLRLSRRARREVARAVAVYAESRIEGPLRTLRVLHTLGGDIG
ncbi:MAG: DNA repair protein RecO [Armatimonadota bacterium]|nr:DNA repair protein RecO [Armatimonadota bacterium]MDR5697307.1 DNA repair protein RecO [Armatimonadota bacterium]